MKVFPINADATEFCVATNHGRFIEDVVFKTEVEARAFNYGYIRALAEANISVGTTMGNLFK
jgi:hypothetical protein